MDASFAPDPNGTIGAIALQPDGKILVGGGLTEIGGVPRSKLARLNEDGSVDASFAPNPDNWALSLVVQPDGRILVGGQFTQIGGRARSNLVRLGYGSPAPAKLTLKKPKRFPATEVGKRSKTQKLRIANAGGSPLTGLSAKLGGKARKDFRATKPARTLAPGASSTIRLSFRPRAAGARKATLTLRSSAAPAKAKLVGRGRA